MISPTLPAARFEHLARMTTADGLFEHALLTEPRRDHGYCLDDVSRGLVVAVREPERTPLVNGMVASYLEFTMAAQDEGGAFHNRRNVDRVWTDSPSLDDHWGRALWAVGTTASGLTASSGRTPWQWPTGGCRPDRPGHGPWRTQPWVQPEVLRTLRGTVPRGSCWSTFGPC